VAHVNTNRAARFRPNSERQVPEGGVPAQDEQHERRLLIDERLHRRVDAEELCGHLLSRRDANLARLNERPPSRGKQAAPRPLARMLQRAECTVILLV
jgi:hypothetical protein